MAMCNNMEVKLVDAEALDVATNALPGTIIDIKDGLKVACAANSAVKINFIALNGIFVPARLAGKFGFAAGQKFAGL